MANDESEKEREFLEGLKARTGRDLGEWMAAIASQGFTDKNAIIDWLRAQGLPFARASWLERIHRNGGMPIHAGPPSEAAGEGRPAADPPVGARQAAAPAPAGGPVPQAAGRQAAKPPPVEEAAGDAAALEKLVAAAKGYRPLYHFLEAQIRQAIPGARFVARGRYVSVGAPGEFAAITLHATEVRLGLDLGERPFGGRLEPAKLRGPGPAITHMVVLTDARQVDTDLVALIESANSRANGPGGPTLRA